MGIWIRLTITPEAINADEWQAFYHEVHAVLASEPSGIVALRSEPAGRSGERRLVLSRDIELPGSKEQGRHLKIDGDLDSRRTGETFFLPYDKPGAETSAAEDRPDLVWWCLEEEHTPGVRVLDAKTQGRPYHHAVLALAMLAEARFPGPP